MQNSPGTHRAWLERDVEFAAVQSIVVKVLRRSPHRYYLCMCRGVAVADDAVLARAYDPALVDNDGTDWHFPLRRCCIRFGNGHMERFDIGHFCVDNAGDGVSLR